MRLAKVAAKMFSFLLMGLNQGGYEAGDAQTLSYLHKTQALEEQKQLTG